MVRGPWRERWQRPGWRVASTVLGGRLSREATAIHATLDQLSPPERRQVDRLTSQAFVARNWLKMREDVADDVAYFIHVATKILQRGTNPPVQRLAAAQSAPTAKQLFSAAVGPIGEAVRLDPAFSLHEAGETRVWDLVRERSPRLARFFTPQPSLDGLLGTEATGDRWCDFGLFAPWLPRPVILEVDGRQHATAQSVDRHRDEQLEQAGFAVRRFTTSEIAGGSPDLLRALDWSVDLSPAEPSPQLVRDLHAPGTVTRVGVALLDLLRDGHLHPGEEWRINLVDAAGWVPETFPITLDLLDAIDRTWQLGVMPPHVITSLGTWRRSYDGYTQTSDETPSDAHLDACVIYEPFVAPWHELTPSRLPTVVLRNTYVPMDLPWLEIERVQPRALEPDASTGPAVVRVMNQLFGFEDFRDGQLEAIVAALAEVDSCVLLPTGSGKSLIYQVAGLLRPGPTLTIDPLVSLVDDQCKRLRQDGIDRVLAIQSRGTRHERESQRLHDELAAGEHHFFFLTPERLQVRRFRDALRSAVRKQPVALAVIDEAHCVSEWGHDFRTAYLRVGRNVRELGRGDSDRPPPLLALTGTASPGVLRDLQNELSGTEPLELIRPRSFDRPNLHYSVITVDEETRNDRFRRAIVDDIPHALGIPPETLARSHGSDTSSGIVFVPHVNGKQGLDSMRLETLRALKESSTTDDPIRVEIYSGKAPKHDGHDWDRRKVAAADAFKDNDAPILVATKAFGMGIDKPNIRWTVHVGYPASLEGFAQEAGRAGRDGYTSQCVLITSPPPASQVAELLDHKITHGERIGAYSRIPSSSDSDLKRQYFFLSNNYAGVEKEFAESTDVVDQVMAAGPGAVVAVPKPFGNSDTEKVLYRLATLAVVDDYTVDHGANLYTIHLAQYDTESIDAALSRFVSRVAPGQAGERLAGLTTAPSEIRDRLLHHLRLLLDLLYDVIEPARVRALAEMHTFATSGDDDAGLRSRIVAYLSDGPAASLMHDIATARTINVQRISEDMKVLPAADPYEWLGAAARQLETYPDHPALLAVRGISEALLKAPDRAVIRSSFDLAFTSAAGYGMDSEELERLFFWALTQMRSQLNGAGASLTPIVFRSWLNSGLDDEVVVAEEERILSEAAEGRAEPLELDFVLTRRLTRVAAAIQPLHRLTAT